MNEFSPTVLRLYEQDLKYEKYAVMADAITTTGFTTAAVSSQNLILSAFYSFNGFMGGLKFFKGHRILPKSSGITSKLVTMITPLVGLCALVLSAQCFLLGENRYGVEMSSVSLGCFGFSASEYFRSKKQEQKYEGLCDLIQADRSKKNDKNNMDDVMKNEVGKYE